MADTCLGRHPADDDRHARLDDAGLLDGDRFERGAQVLLVIEPDRRDGGDQRVEDVGRVEPAAEPDFADRDLDAGAAEQLERHRRRHFEERRVARRARPPLRSASTASRTSRRPRPSVARDDRLAVDRRTAPSDRRDAARCSAPVRWPAARSAASDHRRHRALAVGAGDVH